eukprot:3221081-Amphidinium_carterae.1
MRSAKNAKQLGAKYPAEEESFARRVACAAFSSHRSKESHSLSPSTCKPSRSVSGRGSLHARLLPSPTTAHLKRPRAHQLDDSVAQ